MLSNRVQYGLAWMLYGVYECGLWAILGGYLIWGEVPETFTILGIGLIVTMGAYTFHRERLRNLPKTPVATDTRREI